MHILLNVDHTAKRDKETIDIHYLDPGGTNFSFVTCISTPHLGRLPHVNPPAHAFSANGSKFAMAMACGGVSVLDIRNKVPLRTFMEPFKLAQRGQPHRFLQFSSGNSEKEVLVFLEVRLMTTFCYSYLSNRWSKSLACFNLPSCNHSCDRCDVVWDGRNAFLRV